MKKIISLSLLISILNVGEAQTDSTKICPAQVSFFYPLGTNGTATNIPVMFSFNVLYGINGGLNGAEIGGLFNVQTGHVNGFQVAGLANVNAHAANGMLISGISNIVRDSSYSLCFAGISNTIGGNSSGLQVAGISNMVNGNFFGGQISGISNVTSGKVDGIQIAGISNIAAKDVYGAQISGITNISMDLTGAQIGLINRAQKVSGCQLGLINVADTFSRGVPLGLISFVKHGYHSFELSTSEVIPVGIRVKSGVKSLYTSYSVGYGLGNETDQIAIGLGLGTMSTINDRLSVAFELHSSGIFTKTNSPRLNILSQLEMTARFNLHPNITLFAGPVLNVYASELDPDTGVPALKVPYSLYTTEWWNNNGETYTWIGGRAGIAVNF